MTTIPGVDYAWSHPGGAALKSAGKKFACRYLSTDASKNLTRTEADNLAANGVSSIVVWETTANRALGGNVAGVADAKAALAQATAAGMPKGRPIYFAVDFDATPAQQTAINAYLSGAGSVLGKAATGVYGGFYVVQRALDAAVCQWAWQTMAWSGGQWDARAHIRQGAQKTIGSVSCDLNTAMTADYGQWIPGKAPDPDPGPADVARYQVTVNGLKYGYGATGSQVTKVGQALVKKGFGSHYEVGPGPTWSDADTENYSDFQVSLGYKGTGPHQDADGVPGETTLKKLLGTLPAPATKPKVSLKNLVAAAKRDPSLPQGGTTHAADVKPVEAALKAEGLLAEAYATDGSFGSTTVAAYAAWQRKLGYAGKDADGIPGATTLKQLGAKHGFTTTA